MQRSEHTKYVNSKNHKQILNGLLGDFVVTFVSGSFLWYYYGNALTCAVEQTGG